jgi:hypothetical protein
MTDRKLSLLPTQIQVGDQFTDESGEWEVVTHPAVLHGGKTVHARVHRPGDLTSARDVTWMAHERIVVARSAKPRDASPPTASRPSPARGEKKRGR